MIANGALTLNNLTIVDGQALAPQTARQYTALKTAAREAGHIITIWQPAGGYRSLETQRDMHAHPSLYNIRRGVRLAAVGESTHGQGRAVDIKATLTGRRWVARNAAQYGLLRPNPLGDPDHYISGDPLTTEPEEDDMHISDPVPQAPGDASVGAYLYYTRNDVAKILAGQAALTAAVSALAASKGITDPATLIKQITTQTAAAVEAALKDEFAGIPKAVNDDEAKRLAS